MTMTPEQLGVVTSKRISTATNGCGIVLKASVKGLKGGSMSRTVWISFLGAGLLLNSAALADDPVPPTYSWMLPRTVIDVTIVYTYAGCTIDSGKKHFKIKITPTLTARAIPDRLPGLRTVKTQDLISFWEDRNISITTFGGSHILNSVGANPTNQGSTIIGNILGGVSKIVAIGLGVAAPAAAGVPPQVSIDCPDEVDPAKQIKDYQKKIHSLEVELSTGPADDIQKRDTAQIQALQNLMAEAQSKMSLTLKATIDPGYTDPLNISVDPDAPAVEPTATPVPIKKTGLIASLVPTQGQLKDLKWVADPKDPILHVLLEVNIYLDFVHASVPVPTHSDGYHQTPVGSRDDSIIYRDVAYIPVLVWRGDKDAPATQGQDPLNKAIQLLPDQRMAFAQYGVEETLPIRAEAFKNYSWSITFADDGEITSASFASKSWGANATSLFGTAASTANSIAGEERSAAQAASPSSQASALQAQADLIYETRRLALCQADPGSCSGK
jgi:hypothetical protein